MEVARGWEAEHLSSGPRHAALCSSSPTAGQRESKDTSREGCSRLTTREPDAKRGEGMLSQSWVCAIIYFCFLMGALWLKILSLLWFQIKGRKHTKALKPKTKQRPVEVRHEMGHQTEGARKVHLNRGIMGHFSCDFQNATSANGSWQSAWLAAWLPWISLWVRLLVELQQLNTIKAYQHLD